MAILPRPLTGIFVFFACLSVSPALIVGDSEGTAAHAGRHHDAAAIPEAFATGNDSVPTSDFPYWNNVGKVGLGTGVYLGDGWILTAAHVGCHPFVMDDGSVWQPVHSSYRVFRSADGVHGDLAVFQLSSRPALSSIPLAKEIPGSEAPAVIVGNGFVRDTTSVPLLLDGKKVGTLGYHTKPERAKLWGRAYLDDAARDLTLANANGAKTRVFATRFVRKQDAVQATDGDSGSPAFVYNHTQGRWELAGCVTSVSHRARYVPHGSRSFLAHLPAASDSMDDSVVHINLDHFARPAS